MSSWLCWFESQHRAQGVQTVTSLSIQHEWHMFIQIKIAILSTSSVNLFWIAKRCLPTLQNLAPDVRGGGTEASWKLLKMTEWSTRDTGEIWLRSGFLSISSFEDSWNKEILFYNVWQHSFMRRSNIRSFLTIF